MSKIVFTNDSLKSFIDKIKDYVTSKLATKADLGHSHDNYAKATHEHEKYSLTTHKHTASEVGASASDHNHNGAYYTEIEIDTLMAQKADSSHTHSIANVTNLQSTLNAKAAQTDLDELEIVVAGKANTNHTHTIANVTNLQTTLDSKAANSHTHTVSNITDLTATVAELNYMDGVTSNVQTQLNGKAASEHTHDTVYIPDARNDDRTPTWYMTNYPRQVITEFKLARTIGLPGSNYCKLTTYVQWGDKSGGYPYQEAVLNGRMYMRYGASEDAWNAWITNIDSDNIAAQSVATAASCTGNAATATKLQTARTISLGTGATGTATSFNGDSNITIPVTDVKESYLSWGGRNLVGQVSPVSAALSSEHSANRIAYLNPEAINVQYSNDAGAAWVDSGLSDAAKINLVTTSHPVNVGSNTTVTTNHRTRITLTAQNGTTGYVYTLPRKLLINVSSPHGLNVTVEAKTGVNNASWTTIGTYALSGWSAWNDIPLNISAFGGVATQTTHYWYLRLTFANTSVNASYATTRSTIIGLRLFGETCWTRTSNMGETGHLYSYDHAQNATFPANVTANTFVGSLSGNASTASAVAWSGVTSKPSYYDAKAIKSITRNGTTFTYTCMDGTTGTFTQQDNNTTYSAATTSAAGLMSAADKTKLDNIALTVNSDGVLMLSV